MSVKDRLELAEDFKERLKQNPGDSSLLKIIVLLTDTTKKVSGDEILAMDPQPFFTVSGRNYKSLKEYYAEQDSLPSGKKDGWFIHMLIKKTTMYNEKYRGRTAEASKIIGESFLHRLPYMLFLSLPFFALILKLLYRRRKNFYYSDHAIFTIYHYILSFILLLVMFSISTVQEQTGWSLFSYLGIIIFLAWPVYLLLEMKNFYKQGWAKTAGKFILLNFLGLIVIFILFTALLLLSIFEL